MDAYLPNRAARLASETSGREAARRYLAGMITLFDVTLPSCEVK